MRRTIAGAARRWTEKKPAVCPVCGELHKVQRWAGNKIRVVVCPKIKEKRD
jgi:Zn ribbon nucleic-acid-binding protein